MNDVFDLAQLLFENRAVQIPDVGNVELDAQVTTQQQTVNGIKLIVDGVRREFEGGPDAWSAVCAALVELTEPAQAALATARRDTGADET
ncbi:MAG TPA: hypothetical protein VIM73_07170 [Polyangiaceae bacterium]